MKLAAIVALALVATGVSAQEIEVTTELLKDGKVIQQFIGKKPAGETQTYSALTSHPYKKAPEQGLKPVQGSFNTGFDMSITPKVNSEGDIAFLLNATQTDFIKFDTYKVAGVEFEDPRVRVNSFAPTATVKQGEVREFSADSKSASYRLKVKATALNN